MKIVKRVFVGQLEIDPKGGSIWLNDLIGCLLRIKNLNFNNQIEKFGMIDIRGGEAFMLGDSSQVPEEIEEIEKIVELLLLKVHQSSKVEDKVKFLQSVFYMINKNLEKEKK